MIPSSFQPESIGKTLQQIHEALQRRVENKGYAIYEGFPTADRMPSLNNAGVWIAPVNMTQDQSSPFHTEAFVTEWRVTIVRMETDSDHWDSDFSELYGDVGQLMEALTEDNDDVCLDGAVNWTSDYRVNFDAGQTSGGDKNCVAASFTIMAHHDIFPRRSA